MLILGLDFETTGLDVQNDRFIETGAVLWDVDSKAPVLMESFFTWQEGMVLTEEIVGITGLTKPILSRWGTSFKDGLNRIDGLMQHADICCAHNGNLFDKPLLQAEYDRQSLVMPERTWIDTSCDIPYGEKVTTRKLVHLAAEHNFLNPFAHRAVFDVLTMLKVVDCYADRIDEIISLAKEPSITVQSMTSFNEKELAKARGYRWKADTKQWLKILKKSQVEKEIAEAPFRVRILEEK